MKCRRSGGADGGWSLVPATVLGCAAAAGANALDVTGGLSEVLRWASLLAAVVGVAGYWAVFGLAGLAVLRTGRSGAGQGPRVLWWIASGCGGLAAASLGRVLAAGTGYWPGALVAGCQIVAAVTWAVAAALAVPMTITSLGWLAARGWSSTVAAWPPTFSTGVLSLGALAVGDMPELVAITMIGRALAVATLVLWTITAGTHLAAATPLARHHQQGRGRRPGRARHR
ncbi:MAG: hypothetical protein ACYDH5_05530 [Acidimicrobiales bacterium]